MSFNAEFVSSQFPMYPDDSLSEEIEKKVAASLPVIEKLAATTTLEERLKCYHQKIATARAKFLALNGDAFGCDCNNTDGPAVQKANELVTT